LRRVRGPDAVGVVPRTDSETVVDVVYAIDALRHILSGALRLRTVDESAERDVALVHAALDVAGVDETVRSQPIVQLSANAIVGPLIAAGATPGKWSGNPPHLLHHGPIAGPITRLGTPLVVRGERPHQAMTFFAVMVEVSWSSSPRLGLASSGSKE
jgi:hypothetical protein